MTTTTTIPPITKSLLVACAPETAFRVYTEGANTWWPLDTHTVFDDRQSEVVWEGRAGGEVYERTADGERGHWADVLVWDPPHRLVIAWKVNPNDIAATEVEVRFTAEDGGTRVDVEHRHWELLGPERGRDARAGYDEGWDPVLAAYAAGAAAAG